MSTLLVVESPNKIEKITKALGPGFRVVATCGHLRDLPEEELGVDLRTWEPDYVIPEGKAGAVARIRQAAREASEVLLASDADREGEAIAWHVAQLLGLKAPRRVLFRDLSAPALKEAIRSAGTLDNNLVDAQQARRVLDRLVGYQLSPLLEVLGPGHTAGRVQSATLHLVVEREKARERFRPTPFWTVAAHYGVGFAARVVRQGDDGKWEVARYPTEAEALAAKRAAEANGHAVQLVAKEDATRAPEPPFTTSTLMQVASTQLRFSAERVMALAQSLFEKAAITYHRTDSVTLSQEAITLARSIIQREHPDALPDAPIKYRNSDAAQEAHEAIRPTASNLDADTHLTDEEQALYSLITRRFLSSQCRPALYAKTTVRIVAGPLTLQAVGRVLLLKGFLHYGTDDEADQRSEEGLEPHLPPLTQGNALAVSRVESLGETTKPPPHFTVRSLVAAMTAHGIGRPATTARILALLQERRYIAEEKRHLLATPRGHLVDAAIAAACAEVLDVEYTARMEAQLDAVAAGKVQWKAALTSWYQGFSRRLESAPEALQRFVLTNRALVEELSDAPKRTEKKCPTCGAPLDIRRGKKGAFLACSSEDCDFTADPSATSSTHRCPVCGGPMMEQDGKFGHYARCHRTDCKGTISLAATSEEKCPVCGKALAHKGAFLGCTGYPVCRFTVDKSALEKAKKSKARCPKCERPLLRRKNANGAYLACFGYPSVCRHTEPLLASPRATKSPRLKRGAA